MGDGEVCIIVIIVVVVVIVIVIIVIIIIIIISHLFRMVCVYMVASPSPVL